MEEDGRILGVGNGNLKSHEPKVASYRNLFYGCAQIIVGNIGTKSVMVKGYCEGIDASEVEIPVVEKETP